MPDYIINKSKPSMPKDRSSLDLRAASSPNSSSPRVAGLAVPRKLNAATFTGYKDVTIKLPSIQLNNEDLNSLTEPGLEYFADTGNSCGNRPTNVDAFGLKVSNAGDGSVVQELTCSKTGRRYSRLVKSGIWSDWEYGFTSGNPQTIPTSVDSASRLAVPRKINITGISTGSATFDGTSDVVINLPFSGQLGNNGGNVHFDGYRFNFGGVNENNSIIFGDESIDDRELPTDYYFGSGGTANIRAGAYFIDNQDINNIFSPIGHDHDDAYSKLGHSHEMGDLELPDKLPNPNGLVIKYNGIMYDTYTGEKAIEMDITPDGIGAARSEHGIHVEYADAISPVSFKDGAIGTSNKLARMDHCHPLPTPEDIGASPEGHVHYYAGSDSIAGVAKSASKWETARTITLSGAVTGSVSIDGTANVSINTAVNHNHDNLYYTEAEINAKLNALANSTHTHDDRYYTESEINTKLAGYQPKGSYAASSHTHDDRYYTESEVNTKLNGKANSSHTHAYLSTSGGTISGNLTVTGSVIDMMRSLNKNGYPGMAAGDRGDTNWVRTTSPGLLPYKSGSSSSLGTSSWKFNSAYVDNYYEGSQLVHPPAVQSGGPAAKTNALWCW